MSAGGPLEDWARRAATLPAALVEATPRAVRTGAEVLERAARTNLTAATGGDLHLSRVRSGKGARVDLVVEVKGAGRSALGVVTPTGPVKLVEEATRAHRAPFQYLSARTGGTRSYSMARRKVAGRRGFLYIPGVGYRAHARHPGTSGKQPIGRAFAAAGPDAGVAGVAVFAETARRHMKGS